MPNRTLRESVRTSPTLAAVSWEAEVLFLHIVTAADDFRVFIADPDAVRGTCLPMRLDQCTSDDVANWLIDLTLVGCVEIYRTNGRTYGRILSEAAFGPPRCKEPKYPLPDSICDHMQADASKREQMFRWLRVPQLSLLNTTSTPTTLLKASSRDPSSTTTGTDTDYAASPDALLRARGLLAAVLKWKPDHRYKTSCSEATLRAWAKDIDRLNRIDSVPWGRIDLVINWLPTDPFWPQNIQSGKKLREKFDRLEAQMRNGGNGSAKPAAPRLKTPDELAAADPEEAARLREFRAQYQGAK